MAVWFKSLSTCSLQFSDFVGEHRRTGHHETFSPSCRTLTQNDSTVTKCCIGMVDDDVWLNVVRCTSIRWCEEVRGAATILSLNGTC